MRFLAFLIKRPIGISIIFIALMIYGLIIFREIPISLLPDLDFPALVIQYDFPQASSEQVEEELIKELEPELATLDAVQRIEAYARPAKATLIVHFNWGVNTDKLILQIRDKLSSLKESLPERLSYPLIVKISPSTLPFMKIAIAGDNIENYQLSIMAKEIIKRRLEQMDAVALATVEGESVPLVKVRVNDKKLKDLGLNYSAIKSVIEKNNVENTAGNVLYGQYQLSMKLNNQIKSWDELKDLVVYRKNNYIIRLGQIADIEMSESEKEATVFYDGHFVVLMNIIKRQNANALNAAEEITQLLSEINKEYSALKLEIVYNDADFIQTQINQLNSSMIWGAVFAFFVLLLFLEKFEYSLIIVLSIPLSILLTLIIMYFTGISINVISLSGLALGLGMLVDNAIVILENIVRLHRNGLNKSEAAVRGSKEMASAVIASTLTTIAVFAPLLLLGGIAGEFFKDMSYSIIISLSMSLISSILFVPVLYANMKNSYLSYLMMDYPPFNRKKIFNSFFLKIKWSVKYLVYLLVISLKKILQFIKFKQFLNNAYQLILRIEHAYHKSLTVSLIHYKRIAFLFLFAIPVVLVFFLFIDREYIPQIERPILRLEMKHSADLNLEQINKESLRLSNLLNKFSEIKHVLLMNGRVSQRFADQAELEIQRSVFWIYFDRSDYSILWDKLNQLDLLFPSTKLRISQVETPYEMIFQQNNYINDYLILSDNRILLEQSQLALSDYFGNKIKFFEQKTKEILFSPKKELCDEYQVSADLLIDEIKASTQGLFAGRILLENRASSLIIYSDDNRFQERLIPLRQQKVPLMSFLTKTEQTSNNELMRQRQHSAVYFKSDSIEYTQIKNLLKSNSHVFTDHHPAYYELNNQLRQMIFIIALALLLVYMIMASQFESVRAPFVILLAVPLGLIGVLWALFVFQITINLFSMIGILVLSGVMVNDAIVKVDTIIHNESEGMSRDHAILKASEQRFRPIVMTTLTTTLALVPILLDFSEGYEMRHSLAQTVFWGLTFSTILTLYVIPLLYKLFIKEK